MNVVVKCLEFQMSGNFFFIQLYYETRRVGSLSPENEGKVSKPGWSRLCPACHLSSQANHGCSEPWRFLSPTDTSAPWPQFVLCLRHGRRLQKKNTPAVMKQNQHKNP